LGTRFRDKKIQCERERRKIRVIRGEEKREIYREEKGTRFRDKKIQCERERRKIRVIRGEEERDI